MKTLKLENVEMFNLLEIKYFYSFKFDAKCSYIILYT